MARSYFFAVVGSVLVASSAAADVPLPKDLQYVKPRLRFEGIEAQPDYVFYLRYLTFSGGPAGVPHTLTPVKDAKVFTLDAARRLIDMKLLAMDRKAFAKRAEDDPSLKWLTDKTEGVLSAGVPTPSTTAPASLKEAPVTAYHVALKNGQLTVEMLPKTKRGETAPFGPAPGWVIGLVGAISLVWLGLWLARRNRPRPQAAARAEHSKAEHEQAGV
jgi:hypothetical protein